MVESVGDFSFGGIAYVAPHVNHKNFIRQVNFSEMEFIESLFMTVFTIRVVSRPRFV
jgi:hypothetical protein